MHATDQKAKSLFLEAVEKIAPDQPVGMAIVEADDLAAAEAMAAEDPSLALGLVTVDVRAWGPRMGGALQG